MRALRVEPCALAALPDDAAALFDAAAAEEFQLGRAWFATIAAAALPEGAEAFCLLARAGGRLVAALPLRRGRDGRYAALTAPYTSLYRPLVAADATAADLVAAGRALGQFCRGAGPLRLDALDPAWPPLAPLLAGFRRGGLVPLRFDHFGNWHAPVAGLDWEGWLAARPGALRSTIRRKLARAERDAATGFVLITEAAAVEEGIAAYEAVYAASWKEPEPYPRFAAHLMRAAAQAGALRLALLTREGRAVAAQLWLVSGGVATVHKLAHGEAARALSPGTVLTAFTVRHLLECEHVAGLDFGRGDDAYKAGWTAARRQRIGVLLAPPLHPAGLAALARHAAGRLGARLKRRR
jgi:CelD/BcsL family acetyltransferase involved in cellulose biosynthesis